MSASTFPKAWKTSRISPVPKVDNPKECDDYRPIAILPVLSKVYERLVLSQMIEYIERHRIFSEKILATERDIRQQRYCCALEISFTL